MGPLISRRLDGQLPIPAALPTPPVSRRHSTFSAFWFSGGSGRRLCWRTDSSWKKIRSSLVRSENRQGRSITCKAKRWRIKSDLIAWVQWPPDAKNIGVLSRRIESDLVLLRDTDFSPRWSTQVFQDHPDQGLAPYSKTLTRTSPSWQNPRRSTRSCS